MLNWSNRTPACLPPDHPPVMCVIVDTEEEFDWSQPFARANTNTTAIAAQELAHERIYDHLGIVPTYVIDWPVATTPAAYTALREIMEDGRCEIGAHLHPWVSPPFIEEVCVSNSYAGNLTRELEFEKIRQLTNAITENFQRRPQVFKAGRYGLGPNTATIIEQLGYKVDASVVPHTTFVADGGPDFTAYANQAFWFGSPSAPLLALPVTTDYCGAVRSLGPKMYPKLDSTLARLARVKGILARGHLLERIRLTPEGCTLDEIKRLMLTLQDQRQPMTLTYHSPSLVPGHTPYVRSSQDLETFLKKIELACRYFQEDLGGVFMSATQIQQKMLASKNDNDFLPN